MKEKSLFALKSFENEETDFHLKPLVSIKLYLNTHLFSLSFFLSVFVKPGCVYGQLPI